MSDTEKRVRAEFWSHIGFGAAFSVVRNWAILFAGTSGVTAAGGFAAHAFTSSELAEDVAYYSLPVLVLSIFAIFRLNKAVSDHRGVARRAGRIIKGRYLRD